MEWTRNRSSTAWSVVMRFPAQFINLMQFHSLCMHTMYIRTHMHTTTLISYCVCILCTFIAIRTYGNDMSSIAGAVETKSVDQCEAFMIHYKRKYNLPTLLHNFHLKQRSRKLSEDILTEEVQVNIYNELCMCTPHNSYTVQLA